MLQSVNGEVFTSSGTFNVPAGVGRVNVFVVGGGYTGGGGGELVFLRNYPVDPSSSVSITVGTAGTPGTYSAFGNLKASPGGSGNGGYAMNKTAGGGASGNTSATVNDSFCFDVTSISGGGPGASCPFGTNGGSFGDGGSGYGSAGRPGIVIVTWAEDEIQ